MEAGTARPLIWDNHGCMPLRAGDDSFLPQLQRYRDAGVGVVAITVGFDGTTYEDDMRLVAFFRRWLAARPDQYLLVSTVADIEQARHDGKLAVFFNTEGMAALDNQLGRIALFYDLGVRWMSVAYNRNNQVGGGCQDEDCGLTAFGREVLDEAARVGMMVCCSHTGLRTAREVMEYSKGPVIFSHSNPSAMCEHPRNIPDDVLKACAATGGVIGINGIGLFLGDNDISTDNFMRHVDHAVEVAGVRHVGLGLDYVFDQQELIDFVTNHPELFPADKGYANGAKLVPPEQIPEIVQGLERHGYSPGEVEGILGGNWLRVAKQVWK
jgi:membrane dipeptidase